MLMETQSLKIIMAFRLFEEMMITRPDSERNSTEERRERQLKRRINNLNEGIRDRKIKQEIKKDRRKEILVEECGE